MNVHIYTSWAIAYLQDLVVVGGPEDFMASMWRGVNLGHVYRHLHQDHPRSGMDARHQSVPVPVSPCTSHESHQRGELTLLLLRPGGRHSELSQKARIRELVRDTWLTSRRTLDHRDVVSGEVESRLRGRF